MSFKKNIKFFLGILVSIVLMMLAFYDIKWDILFQEIKNFSSVLMSLYLFFIFLNCFFRAILWKVTTSPLGKTKFSDLFGGVVAGLLVNNFLPFRLGDLYRVYYLSSKTNFSKMAILSTVVTERILDVFSLFVLFGAGILFGLSELNQQKSSLIILFFIAVIVFLALFFIFLRKIILWIETARFIPGKTRICNMLKPMLNYTKFQYLCAFAILCFLIWGSLYLSNYFLLYDIAKENVRVVYILLIFLYLGLLIPASPGGLGVIQVAFIFSLSFFGISKEQALSLSIVYQGLYYIFTIVLGIPFIAFSGVKDFLNQKENLA